MKTIVSCVSKLMWNCEVYPVENVSPALHSDALEDRQHCEENVVEVCDAAVGALPLAPALGSVPDAEAAAAGKRTG